MSLQRMIPFLLLNIVVSAIVAVIILSWGSRGNTNLPVPTVVPTQTTVPLTSLVTPIGNPPTVAPSTNSAVSDPTTSTPTSADAVPTQESITHQVQPGDSLGSISSQYGVLMDDISRANGISDPNSIYVGQNLIIPVGGLPEPTPAPATAVPTPLQTIAVETGVSVINITGVNATSDINSESLSIANDGANPVNLQGWTVENKSGQKYSFQNQTLFSGGAAIMLHSRVGQNDATSAFWGLDAPIWTSGEVVTLRDANGVVQATFAIP